MMEKARRKEREFNLRRMEILEKAEKIFSAKGFHSTTIAEIANTSGFAVGTLYQFFQSKEALYTTMLTEKLATMYTNIRESSCGNRDVVEKIEGLISSHFSFVESNADFCRIFVRGDHLSLSAGSEKLRQRLMADYTVHVSFIEEVMREGIQDGILKKLEPRMMAVALTGIINSCASKWLTMSDGTSLIGNVPFVLELFLQGVGSNGQ